MGYETHFHGKLEFTRELTRSERTSLEEVLTAGRPNGGEVSIAAWELFKEAQAAKGLEPDLGDPETIASLKGFVTGDHVSAHDASSLRISDDGRGLVYCSDKTYDMVGGVNFIIANAREVIPDFGLKGELLADTEFEPGVWVVAIGEDGRAHQQEISKKEFLAKREQIYPDGYHGPGLIDLQYPRAIDGHNRAHDQEPEIMTQKLINQDFSKAVTLKLPEDADYWLLRNVDSLAAWVTERAQEKMADAIAPEEKAYWNMLALNGQARWDEAHDRLLTLERYRLAQEHAEANPLDEIEAGAAITALDEDDHRHTMTPAEKPEGAADVKGLWDEYRFAARDTFSQASPEQFDDFLAREAALTPLVEERIEAYRPVPGEFESFQAFRSATDHLAQAEAQAIRLREIEPDPEDTTHDIAGGVRSALGVSSKLSRGLFNVASTVMGVVIGYFVDEPKLTPQQVHDTLQASASSGNLDAAHAQAVAAEAAVATAQAEYQAHVEKTETQHATLDIGRAFGANATTETTRGVADYEPAHRSSHSIRL